MHWLAQLSPQIRQYLLVTANYWSFTLTDGALRLLVVLYFYQLGYTPLAIAMLFLFYEFFGIVTNLIGGWLAARWGLNRTMNIGLCLQLLALGMLLVPTAGLTVPWVMAAQALSGIAKDLNKMSAKSAIKLFVKDSTNPRSPLFRWVALLTGSKNALKGVGFFIGAALLSLLQFRGAVLALIALLMFTLLLSLIFLTKDLGKSKNKAKFSQIFSTSRAINVLSAARLFLFASRDIWFVVALPVYLATTFGWNHWQVGSLLALWVIGYGAVQSITPRIIQSSLFSTPSPLATRTTTSAWAIILTIVPLVLAIFLTELKPVTFIIGLILYGAIFAINSSWHSYLVVSYAREDGTSMDVGFYYMANAAGRMFGTILSGWAYQNWGLASCLYIASAMIALSALCASQLPSLTALSTDTKTDQDTGDMANN